MSINFSPAIESLRDSIEALSLEVALRDFDAEEGEQPLRTMLANIGEQAGSAGMMALAELASSIPDTAPGWLDSLTRMQQFIAEPQLHKTAGAPGPTANQSVNLALNQDPELVSDFILESREHLSTVESQLLALEQDPGNSEAINTIFRGFHTIKGLAGFLEYPQIQRFAHEVETLLDMARNAKLAVDSSLIDLILQSADHMNECLLSVETGLEPASDVEPLIARLKTMTEGSTDSSSIPARLAMLVAEPARPVVVNQEAIGGPRSVKVDTSKLDYLVDMVGELVIAQSMIQHDPDMASMRSQKLNRNLAQLTRITGDVQRVAMAMRMHPVGQLFQRMARLVRDLARKSGKQVNLELSGEDTELDRNLVEELADPLMHMVRNAVDHGAESAEARRAVGKEPTARIELKAYHQGGFIHIEISDDGRGLSRQKLLAKARQLGLVSGGDQLSDQEVFGFIMEPGFSTAEKITDISGRGVGMDVVRKQITKLRGRIDINSRPGYGTTFVLKLPLTLAIIEGLVVGVGVQRYIIPIFAVKEMFRPVREALSWVPGGGEMVLVRGALFPILRLYSRFGVEPISREASSGVLVVVESARKQFCILVDELIGKQEVVIKSLGETFKNVTGVAGATILGDGRVGLILDVEALYGHASAE